MAIRKAGAGATDAASKSLILVGIIVSFGFNAVASAQPLIQENGAARQSEAHRNADDTDSHAAVDEPVKQAESKAAQDAQSAEPVSLGSVIVTARKREERMVDAPIAISKIAGLSLERNGYTNFRNIGSLFPGVSFNDSNQVGGHFSIRGLASGGSGSEKSIALYVDGVYVRSTAAAGQRLFDLGGIQVLRGPQVTLFGHNSIAGAISIVTKKPQSHFGGYLNLAAGNYNLRRWAGAINVPIISDRLMTRFSFMSKERGGFLENTGQPGVTANNKDGWSGRLQVLGKPTDSLKLLFKAYKAHDNTCDNMFQVVGGAIYDGSTDPDLSAWDGPCRHENDANGYSLHAEQDLSGLTFTSITAYRERTSSFLTDRDFTSLPILITGLDLDYSYYTQEFRLASDKDQEFIWMAGVYYLNLDQHQNTILDLGPGFLGPGNRNLVQAIADTSTSTYAAYASGEWAVSDRLNLGLGLRYSYEEKSLDYVQTATMPIPGFARVAPFDESFGDGVWSPTATATYALDPGSNIYVRIAQGHKAGGFNTGPSSNPDHVVFEPERLTSYEAGYKTAALNGRLEFAGDVYYLVYNDIQLSRQSGAGFYISNAASARSYGAETQLTAHMWEHAKVRASLGYVDAEFQNYGDKSGNLLPRAPRWTGALTVNFNWNIGNVGNMFVIPEVTYRSENYVDAANTELFKQRAHTIYNLRLGYTSFAGWTVAAWVRNATNERYTLGGFAVAPVLYATTPSAPRTYGLEVRWAF